MHSLVAEAVPPGVVVVDASGVAVGGIAVGRDKPGLVGGRVEVTKRGASGAGVSSETLMHELRLRVVIRRSIQILFIWKLYTSIIKLAFVPYRVDGAANTTT